MDKIFVFVKTVLKPMAIKATKSEQQSQEVKTSDSAVGDGQRAPETESRSRDLG